MKKVYDNPYVVNFFATPVPNYTKVIEDLAKKETANPIYSPKK